MKMPIMPATSRMDLFATIVKGWKPLKIVTKSLILDVAEVLISFGPSDNQQRVVSWHN